ncbi:MAG TPA: roadblock/LC7 domain-containing protein [Armatimonadota bacterium]|jgi:predicted regulator of Ras-like GTPase activity (Roadblock/LC7/MglB family)
MSAAQTTELHAALKNALTAVASAGQFRVVALADAQGLPWAFVGDAAAPDQLASIPALLSRAFEDRQMLLRFFSEKTMRFEYRSDSLAYIKSTVEGAAAGAAYNLDVPADKDAHEAVEFVLNWDNAFLVLRRFAVEEEMWAMLGIAANPVPARAALQKAIPGIAEIIRRSPESAPALGILPEMALHAKMTAALEGFQAAAPDIQMAAVTSKDGFVVAALEGGLDAEVVAPLMGHAFMAIQESTQVLCGATQSVMLRMEDGILLARELTDDLLFAALLAPNASTGLIRSAFEAAANQLRIALEDMESAVHVSQESLEVAV